MKQQYYFHLQLCKQEEQKDLFADPLSLRQCYSKLTAIIKQKAALKTYLVSHYPEYANLEYQDSLTSLLSIQETLFPQQTLLEYTLTDSFAFIFVITKDTFFMHRQQWHKGLTEEVENLCYLIRTRPDLQPNRFQASTHFVESAYSLYQQLLLPVAAYMREELILIPDGILCYIPFDVLIQETNKRPTHLYANHAYLGRNHAISYCYSATLLRLMATRQLREVNNKILAIAPSFKNNEMGLRPLEYNTQETKAITTQWRGINWQEEEANKVNFLKQAGEFRFLHLATHCALESNFIDDSFLAFSIGPESPASSSLLYMPEVFGLSLQAEMVILSACQTGIGTHYNGEGLTSMARAFAYAGAKCVVATLWSIDDKQTSVLMESFYKYLTEGKSKPEALHLARMRYFEDSGHELAHPYYWAAMISIGDPVSVEYVPVRSFAWAVGWKPFLILTLAIGILVFINRSRLTWMR